MSKIELVAIYWIIGTSILAWLLFIGTAIFGYQLGFWLALLLSCGLLTFAIKRTKRSIQNTHTNYQQLIFVFAWGILFTGLLQTRMLEQKVDGWYSGGATWGDLALHTSFITKFATQPELDLTSPIYAQEKTHYPFLYDFYTAQFVRHGNSIQHALIYTSLSLLLASLVLFYRVVFALTKSVRGVWVASCLFFLNGGLGFWYFLQDYLQGKQSFFAFVQKIPLNYSHIADKGVHFSNIITDLLLPQRGIILGLAVFLVVLTIWQRAKSNYSLWILSSTLIGLLPLIHVHTFLLLLGCLGWLLMTQRIQKTMTTNQAVLALLPAVILGAAQLWWMGVGEQGSHFIKIIHGWMEPKESIGWFWLKNLGLELFFLTLGNVFIFWKTKKRTILHYLLPPLVLVFFIGNVVSLQPHVYDNIKLFFYIHLLTAFFTTVLLLKLAKFSRILAAICFITLTSAGMLSVVRESQVSWPIATKEDLRFAEQIQASTKSTAIFLTADNHNHPIPMLAGRSVVLGYRGWLWTHGIAYWQTEGEVRKIYAGESDALELLRKHQVAYIVIGNEEKQQYTVSESFFYENFPVLLRSNSRTVFVVQ
ncbi:MAG: hypothetical protein GW947_01025 [Candidatus Pacebacteria bacterium]|nr:hypothetical protein [Candidatus Paceibacterota bacterium]PIR59605.1 MAG: hypothetical protein COU68_04750 [Candidatus Pacebacteria bacterium CG10_big_fil_rev_8_21_14_0_10_45_6]